ncbi:hypothetical protein POBR111598_10460 [Polynucleobacter brandtiae]
MMPDRVKLPSTVIVLALLKVILPEMAPVPVVVLSAPPLKVIGSAPIFAWISKMPPLTVVPLAVPPKALSFVTTRVPTETVVKPVYPLPPDKVVMPAPV